MRPDENDNQAQRDEVRQVPDWLSNMLLQYGPPKTFGTLSERENILVLSGPNKIDERFHSLQTDARKVMGPQDLPFALGVGFRNDETFQKTNTGFSSHYRHRDGRDVGEFRFDGRRLTLDQHYIQDQCVEFYLSYPGFHMPDLARTMMSIPEAWEDDLEVRLRALGNIHYHWHKEKDYFFAGFPGGIFVSLLIPIPFEMVADQISFYRNLAFQKDRDLQMPSVALRIYLQTVNYMIQPSWDRSQGIDLRETVARYELMTGGIPVQRPLIEIGAGGSKSVTCRKLVPVQIVSLPLRDVEPLLGSLVGAGFISSSTADDPDFTRIGRVLETEEPCRIREEIWSTFPFSVQVSTTNLGIHQLIQMWSPKRSTRVTFACSQLTLSALLAGMEFSSTEEYGEVMAKAKLWVAASQCLRESLKKSLLSNPESRTH